MSDSDLMKQIATLAGAINRHKNSQNQQSSTRGSHSRGSYSYRRADGYGRYRGRYRGAFRGGITKPSRQDLVYKRVESTNTSGNLKDTNSTTSDAISSLKEEPKPKKVIGGVAFALERDDTKLVPLSNVNPNNLPKSVLVDGNLFRRSKSGSYWKVAAVKKLKNEPCRFYTMTGECSKGLSCPYKHDPEHVAICKDYLHSNYKQCKNPICTYSHHPNEHNSPACTHFLRGHCSNPNCLYTHQSKLKADPKICKDFALLGYCDKGAECENLHVFDCPEFQEQGVCPRGKKCKLRHTTRAFQRPNDLRSDVVSKTDPQNKPINLAALTQQIQEDDEQTERREPLEVNDNVSSEFETDDELENADVLDTNEDFVKI